MSTEQLRALGVSRGALEHWQRAGRLRPLHRGVHAVGHAALRREGRWLAAVLACGPGAMLSHASAAALWGIRATAAARVDVCAPRSRGPRVGLRVHRPRALAPDDIAAHDGIPLTSVARTLLDLAAVVSSGDLEATMARASALDLLDPVAVADVLARAGGHRGAARLRRATGREPRLTRSALERRFLRLVRDAGLPDPETNVWITLGGGEEWQLDALWRAARVSVELDGWATHRTRKAFEDDRTRAAALTAAGFRHLQITHRRIVGDAPALVRTLRALVSTSR